MTNMEIWVFPGGNYRIIGKTECYLGKIFVVAMPVYDDGSRFYCDGIMWARLFPNLADS
jgi:hypothetical protein